MWSWNDSGRQILGNERTALPEGFSSERTWNFLCRQPLCSQIFLQPVEGYPHPSMDKGEIFRRTAGMKLKSSWIPAKDFSSPPSSLLASPWLSEEADEKDYKWPSHGCVGHGITWSKIWTSWPMPKMWSSDQREGEQHNVFTMARNALHAISTLTVVKKNTVVKSRRILLKNRFWFLT